jgi:diguanylate cyclase (GGDEF)-like protein/PAS domain S-box-containing protein
MSKELVATDFPLREAERRFQRLVEGTEEYAIFRFDPAGNITNWSPGAERFTGYRADEILGKSFARFYSGVDRLLGVPEKALLVAARQELCEQEGWRLRKGGEKFWAHTAICAFRDDAGEVCGFAELFKDMTEQKLEDERLHRLAYFDPLTGLRNRISLLNDLKSLAGQDGDTGLRSLSVIMLDLDAFKDVNNALGHAAGDRAINQIAKRLRDAAGDAGNAYRLGGDEFTLVLPGCGDALLASEIAIRVMKMLEEPMEVGGHFLQVSASAGIATAPAHGASVEELIAGADLALHDAKGSGGRKWSMFAPAMRAKATARQELNCHLRRAHHAGEFELRYQPQVRLSDGLIVGAEALLRWRRPDHGVLAPAAFIEALARSPVAMEVGHWIVQSVCEMGGRWRARGLPPLRLALNLFPEQFHDRALPADIERALRRNNMPPESLELEIIENVALGDEESAQTRLQDLRAIGVGVALDDFGTGHASLGRLTHYPLTRLKIDRSFVEQITDRPAPADTAAALSIIALARSLSLGVIAEGVETESQAKFLRDNGCEEGQGFLFAKPLPPEEFEALFRGGGSQARAQERRMPLAV